MSVAERQGGHPRGIRWGVEQSGSERRQEIWGRLLTQGRSQEQPCQVKPLSIYSSFITSRCSCLHCLDVPVNRWMIIVILYYKLPACSLIIFKLSRMLWRELLCRLLNAPIIFLQLSVNYIGYQSSNELSTILLLLLSKLYISINCLTLLNLLFLKLQLAPHCSVSQHKLRRTFR